MANKYLASLLANVKVIPADKTFAVAFNQAERSELGYSEYAQHSLIIANGASDQAINFGGVVTARIALLTSDQTITFKLNGGAAIQGRLFLLQEAALTALSVSNASGKDANLQILLIGV